MPVDTPQPPAPPAPWTPPHRPLRDLRVAHDGLVVTTLVATALGLVVFVLPDGPVRLIALLAFATVGPGAALMVHLQVASPLARWCLAITASLTAIVVSTGLMIWTDLWNPLVAHVVLVLVTGTSGIAAAVSTLLPTTGPDDETLVLPRQRPAPAPRVASSFVPPALLAAGALAWAYALYRFEPADIGNFGLTFALGVPFVLALVMTCVAVAIEIAGRIRTAVLAVGAVLFALEARAATSILFDHPQYPWTYKHVGVVDLFLTHGHVVDSGDIYQKWPTFFTSAGYLAQVSGVGAIEFAGWSPLYFALLQVVLVAGVVRTLTANRRVVAGSAFLFEVCSWPETNYFSPQAMAYTLGLGFLLIVLGWLRTAPSRRASARRWFARVRRWAAQGVPGVAPSTPVGRAWVATAAIFVFFALTSAHQLTPFMLLAPLVVLAVLGQIRPRYLVPVLVVVVAAYVVPRLGVAGQYTIFSGFDILRNAGGTAQQGWATPGQTFSAIAARALALAMWGTAMVSAFLMRKEFGRAVLPTVLGFTPFVFMVAGNYGGELIYRVYMFSLPWCAFLATLLVQRVGTRLRDRVPAAGRSVAAGLLVTVLAMAALQGTQGQVVFDRVSAASVESADYFYANARPGSVLVLGTPNWPARLDARYRLFSPGQPTEPTLLDDRGTRTELRALPPGPYWVPTVTRFVDSYAGSGHYLALSQGMVEQARYFGHLPDGSLQSLTQALRTSPQWRVFYQNAEVVIFERAGET